MNSYATLSSLNNYLTTASATSNHLTQADASSSYVAKSALTNSAFAYINSSGQLSSSASNLYVQKGVNTIQSAIDAIISNSYSSIQLSSGQFVENIVLSKSHYTLLGPARISGNVTLGVLGIRTDNISIKD